MLDRRNATRPDEEANYAERPLMFSPDLLRQTVVPDHSPKGEEKLSVFWRVFGGTLLSIAGLIVIQAYQSLANNIHEVRSDLSRLREVQADYVKKDDFGSRTSSLWNRVQELNSLNAAVSVAGNKLAALEQQLVMGEKDRKETQASIAVIAPMKDRLGVLEEHKKVSDADHKELMNLVVTLNAVREKDALLEKQLREAEIERKDLIRELQALRERLAKLEGTKSANETK